MRKQNLDEKKRKKNGDLQNQKKTGNKRKKNGKKTVDMPSRLFFQIPSLHEKRIENVLKTVIWLAYSPVTLSRVVKTVGSKSLPAENGERKRKKRFFHFFSDMKNKTVKTVFPFS